MGILQDALERAIAESVKVNSIRQLFAGYGVPLSAQQLDTVIQAIDSGSDSIEIDGLTESVSICPDDIDHVLLEVEGKLDGHIDGAIKKVLEEVAPKILKSLYAALPDELRELRTVQDGFERRLHQHWRDGLDRLDMLVIMAHEAGETYVKDLEREFAGQPESEESHLLDALVMLHCRACRTAREVLCLLKAGHADGANARWRSLHELAVIGIFLAQYRGDAPQRYRDHDVIECWRAAQEYETHCRTLGYEPLPAKELAELKEDADDAIAKYGHSFRGDYGWAAKALSSLRPSFADIEKSLDMSKWRPFFRLACQSVHAGSQGLYFSLGLPETADTMLLAGASDAGLADPGQQTAISLMLATVALLTARPNLDRLVSCECLRILCDNIGNAFALAQERWATIAESRRESRKPADDRPQN